jgi:hypothetical protein
VGGQYLLIEPGANPVLYVTRSETEDNKSDGGSGGGIGSAILGIISNLPFISNFPFFPSSGTSEPTPAEESTQKPNPENENKVRTPKPNGHYMKLIAYRTQILLLIFLKYVVFSFKRYTFCDT